MEDCAPPARTHSSNSQGFCVVGQIHEMVCVRKYVFVYKREKW